MDEFTDDELAFLRHVRFGELPARIRPEERVELTETESRRDRPDDPPAPDDSVYPYWAAG
ncbi:hypothetical protein ACFFX1_04730 [Dactylosporangium sucinum]|uniref:Uncharacterized protein n=1 Tax=Dactylosporangium sucinum TaxID=1424081 RepID=A0A917X3R9_9ACTN|nr:hypothetical protein [Dactylosporangium sucinum]GGM60188.1 hypothetical protein GCM10007977_072120 [Dactylosporangium sucinum]